MGKKKGKGVRYGIRNVHVAWYDEEQATFGTPFALPGCRTLKTSPEGDTKKWFADDVVYYIGRANNGYTGELEMAKIALQIMAEAQGWEYDETNDVMFEVTGGDVAAKPFALLFEVEGDESNTRFCYYNCTLDRPEHEWGTTEDGIEPTTEKVGLSIDPLSIGEKGYVKAMAELTEKNQAVFDKWFKQVHMPTASAPQENVAG